MKVVRSSPLRTGLLYPQEFSWYSFLEADSTPGHMLPSVASEKFPATPLEIDPETLRLVAQCLNHYGTPGPIIPMWCMGGGRKKKHACRIRLHILNEKGSIQVIFSNNAANRQLIILIVYRLLFDGVHSSVICHTTGPQPLPKRFLHLMRSRASSFKWEYPLLSPRSSSNFLRLLPRLLVTSIHPFDGVIEEYILVWDTTGMNCLKKWRCFRISVSYSQWKCTEVRNKLQTTRKKWKEKKIEWQSGL
jgi:hypothetical protein